MALIQGLLAMLTRSLGRILNTVFGWATAMLFGKVPEDRQIYLSVIAFAAVLWFALLVGVLYPSAGTFLLGFVPLPEWIDENTARMIMLGGAILVPGIVGLISLRMVPAEERKDSSTVKTILFGYPYTLGLALTLLLLTIFAPIMKVQELIKRWSNRHIPIVVEAQHYEQVVKTIQTILKGAGIENSRQQATWMLRFPTWILTTLAASSHDKLVAKDLATLTFTDGELLLHPSDLVIRGKEEVVTRLSALISEKLVFSPAHLTWTKEAQEIEDSLLALWRSIQKSTLTPKQVLDRLDSIDEQIRNRKVEYEEWEALYRARSAIERAVLRPLAESAQGNAELDQKTNEALIEEDPSPHGSGRTSPEHDGVSRVMGVATIIATSVRGLARAFKRPHSQKR